MASRAQLAATSPGFARWAAPGRLAPLRGRSLVGPGRVERPTSRLSGVRSNHLSYEPDARRQGSVIGYQNF